VQDAESGQRPALPVAVLIGARLARWVTGTRPGRGAFSDLGTSGPPREGRQSSPRHIPVCRASAVPGRSTWLPHQQRSWSGTWREGRRMLRDSVASNRVRSHAPYGGGCFPWFGCHPACLLPLLVCVLEFCRAFQRKSTSDIGPQCHRWPDSASHQPRRGGR